MLFVDHSFRRTETGEEKNTAEAKCNSVERSKSLPFFLCTTFFGDLWSTGVKKETRFGPKGHHHARPHQWGVVLQWGRGGTSRGGFDFGPYQADGGGEVS